MNCKFLIEVFTSQLLGGFLEPPRASWRRLGGLETASLALTWAIFVVTLSMPQRTALDLEQLSFRILFGKCFGRVWDGLGSFLGVVWKCKSSDFVKDMCNKSGFQTMSFENTSSSPLGRFLYRSGDHVWGVWESFGELLRATNVDFELMSVFSQWTSFILCFIFMRFCFTPSLEEVLERLTVLSDGRWGPPG